MTQQDSTGPRLHHVGYVVRAMAGALRRFEEAGGELVVAPPTTRSWA